MFRRLKGCTGKSILPVFLASFVAPSLALQLIRE